MPAKAHSLRIIADRESELRAHVDELLRCKSCKEMIRPVVSGAPVLSPVMLVGQAPGIKEGSFGKPFAWTAGKTMFGWFGSLGLAEEEFRRRVYMAAVCRCFPGKNPKGGDRVPNPLEIQRCARWLDRELSILQPELVIPVGKLAISQFIDLKLLDEVVGSTRKVERNGARFDLVPLPHPSGASTWHRTAPGKMLLEKALGLIGAHPAFRKIVRQRS